MSSPFVKGDGPTLVYKVSTIIRAVTAFRASELVWINDLNERRKLRTIEALSRYALAPPYVKKYFPMSKELRNVGLLDPTQLPIHPSSSRPVEGELRRGVRVGEILDLGLQQKFKGEAGTYLVTNSSPLSIRRVESFVYEGPVIKVSEWERIWKLENVVIGSRSCGDPLRDSDRLKELYEKRGLTLLLGPPRGGLLRKWKDGLCYNFAQNQGVKDLRTEEALWSALSILNLVLQ